MAEPSSNARTLPCPHCGVELDITGLEPFAPFDCPACQKRSVVPLRLGAYDLLERIGAGAMGEIYRAHDRSLQRSVAVKLMTAGSDPSQIERFLREARVAAKLQHPNIIQVYSVGEEAGRPYMAMELLEGGSLDAFLSARQPADELRVLTAAQDVCRGLEAAHRAGLLHGDIKPANILFDRTGAARLTDFGVAEFMFQDPNQPEIWGTPYYVAPERVRRERLDHRADFFSLGATLFHVLTGSAPFAGRDSAEIIKARLQQPAPDILTVRPDLGQPTADIINRMLALAPADRPPTHAALEADLQYALATVKARRHTDRLAVDAPAPARAPAPKAPRRAHLIPPAIAIVLGLLAAAIAYAILHSGRSRPPAFAETLRRGKPDAATSTAKPSAAAAPLSAAAPPPAVAVPSAATASAAAALDAMTPEQAARYIGRSCTVTGEVTDARYLPNTKTRPTLINFGPPYPRQHLTLVIPQSLRAQFPEPPEFLLMNRSIRATGVVRLMRGKPQIEITQLSDITW